MTNNSSFPDIICAGCDTLDGDCYHDCTACPDCHLGHGEHLSDCERVEALDEALEALDIADDVVGITRRDQPEVGAAVRAYEVAVEAARMALHDVRVALKVQP